MEEDPETDYKSASGCKPTKSEILLEFYSIMFIFVGTK